MTSILLDTKSVEAKEVVPMSFHLVAFLRNRRSSLPIPLQLNLNLFYLLQLPRGGWGCLASAFASLPCLSIDGGCSISEGAFSF